MGKVGMNLKGNHQGIFLISAAALAVIMVVLTMALLGYQRSIIFSHKVQKDSVQAVMRAQEGIAYALKEIELHGPGWSTHTNYLLEVLPSSPPDSEVQIIAKDGDTELVETSVSGAIYLYDDADQRGYYSTEDARFQVKVYPEARFGDTEWAANNVTVILSQATVGRVTRTIEARVTRQSLYKYFYFFPETHRFTDGIFDGRTLGGIHVNGDIILSDNPEFHYLSELSLGSNVEGEGHIRRWHLQKYSDSGAYDEEATLEGSPTDPIDLLGGVKYGQSRFWSDEETQFFTGDPDNPVSKLLPAKLPAGLDPDAIWDTDKYYGEPPDYDVHFQISDDNLKDLAAHEVILGYEEEWALFFDPVVQPNKEITIFYDDGSGWHEDTFPEKEAFETAYNADGVVWEYGGGFWNQWKTNHSSDYTGFAGENWERRFWAARYDITDANNVASSDFAGRGINWEWWEDLEYATERPGSNDEFPAVYIDPFTGAGSNLFYLDSAEQPQAFGEWLDQNPTLKDIIKVGGDAITPIRPDKANYMQTAFDDGIYIVGLSINGDIDNNGVINQDDVDIFELYLDEFNIEPGDQGVLVEDIYPSTGNPALGQLLNVYDDGEVDYFNWDDRDQADVNIGVDPIYTNLKSPLAENLPEPVTSETYFYNAHHTPQDEQGVYQPSNVLKIDVNALNQGINQGQIVGFNGIIYIDVANYQWEEFTPGYNDPNAAAVMLHNGEILPQEVGLSLATENNVFIKGCFNLDGSGASGAPLWRDPDDDILDVDDGNVIPRVITRKDYVADWEDLVWQPAAIISTRTIYTLSDGFPEPADYMPLCYSMAAQYNREVAGRTPGVDIIEHPDYGKPDEPWMPGTDPDEPDYPPSDHFVTIDNWFTWMDEAGNPQPRPHEPGDDWNDWCVGWVEQYWGTVEEDRFWTFDTDGDEVPDETITAQQLKTQLKSKVSQYYREGYAYGEPLGPPWRVNEVGDERYIYNTAIATPYNTETYHLETWLQDPYSEANRLTINGVFIQLPDEPAFKEDIPAIEWNMVTGASSPYEPIFTYESYFGGDNPHRPAGELLGSVPATWRVIANSRFSSIEQP